MLPREPRTSVMLSARVWKTGWDEPSVHRLINISANGACVARATSLVGGDVVTVQIGSMEAVAASVAWSRHGVAGLRFAEPIDINAARRSRTDTSTTTIAAGWFADRPDAYRR